MTKLLFFISFQYFVSILFPSLLFAQRNTNLSTSPTTILSQEYRATSALWDTYSETDSLERLANAHRKNKKDEAKTGLIIARAIIARGRQAPPTFFSPIKPFRLYEPFNPDDRRLLIALSRYFTSWQQMHKPTNSSSHVPLLSAYCQSDSVLSRFALENVEKRLVTLNPDGYQDKQAEWDWLKNVLFADETQTNQLKKRLYLLFRQSEGADFSQLQLEYKQAIDLFRQQISPEKPQSLVNYLTIQTDWTDYQWSYLDDSAIDSYLSIWTEAEPQMIDTPWVKRHLLQRLGRYYIQKNELSRASYYLNRALDIAQRKNGIASAEYAETSLDLAFLYATNNKARCLQLLNDNLPLLKKSLNNQADYISGLLLQAELLYQNNQFYEAEQVYQSLAVRIRELLGNSHPQYVTAFYNLAAIEQTLSKFDNAYEFYKTYMYLNARQPVAQPRADPLTISQRSSAIRKPDQAPLVRLINWLRTSQSVAYIPQTQGELMVVLNQEAAQMAQDKQLKRLDSLYTPLQTSFATVNPKPSTYFARMLDYGNWLTQAGGYDQSATILNQVKTDVAQTFGTHHRLYIKTLLQLADVYYRRGDKAEAKNTVELAFYEAIQQQQLVSELLPQRNSQLYKQELDGTHADLLRLITNMHTTTPDITTMAYGITLRQKETLLRNQRTLLKELMGGDDKQLETYYESYQSARNAYQTLFLNVNRIPDEERKLLTLQQTADQAEENILTHLSQRKKKKKKQVPVTWESLRNNLKPEDAIVEFFRLPNSDLMPASYWALVGKKSLELPHLIPLCDEEVLTTLLASAEPDSINELYSNRRSYKGKTLSEWIWKPIVPLLAGAKRISYVPSGLMHRLSFAGIFMDKDTSTTYERLLSSQLKLPSDIPAIDQALAKVSDLGYLPGMANNPKISQYSRFSFWGGIDYNATEDQLIRQNMELKKWMTFELKIVQMSKNPFSVESNRLNIRGKDESLSSDTPGTLVGESVAKPTWAYLPGTFSEVNQITEQLNQSKWKPPIRVFTRSSATEEAFKSLEYTANVWGMGSPEFIHVATHGFFNDRARSRSAEVFSQYDDPLLRAGLIMAGGEGGWRGKSWNSTGLEDGILTAYEIANLNLSNTKIVVLSACETALGDNLGSEGTFGLQRAFKMAGVGAIIMSLWKVPDAATADMMQHFYKFVTQGQTIDVAFRNAQYIMKQTYAPYAWAGFILVK